MRHRGLGQRPKFASGGIDFKRPVLGQPLADQRAPIVTQDRDFDRAEIHMNLGPARAESRPRTRLPHRRWRPPVHSIQNRSQIAHSHAACTSDQRRRGSRNQVQFGRRTQNPPSPAEEIELQLSFPETQDPRL